MQESNSSLTFIKSEKSRNVFRFLGISSLSFLLRYPGFFIQGLVFYIFQDRDISRTQELLSGKMIFFGPELTGGGNLPGPFYYFLLSPAVALGLDWVNTWYWMFILMAMGGVCGWYFIRAQYDSVTATIWLLLFSFLQPIQHLINTFFNPSFSILFLVLANVLTLKSFADPRKEVRNRSILFSFFICALIIQIHYSGITQLFAILFLALASEKLGLPSPDRKKMIQGFGIFLLTLSPFFIWQVLSKFNIYLGQPQSYVGSTSGSIPSLLAYFKISTSFSQFMLLCLQKLFLVLPIIFLIGLIYKAFIFKLPNLEETKSDETSKDSLFKVLLTISVFNFIPFSFYFFVPQGSRYGAPFAISMSFLAIVVVTKIFSSEVKWKKFNSFGLIAWLIMLGFILYWGILKVPVLLGYYSTGLVLILLSAAVLYWKKAKNNLPLLSFILIGLLAQTQGFVQARLAKSIHAEGNMPVYWQWKAIWPRIYLMTGWSKEEAFARTYFINHQREQSARRAYDYFVNGLNFKSNKMNKKPDGFFVSIDKKPGLDLKEWMLTEPIQQELKEALISGDIVIGKYEMGAKVTVAPYFVVNKVKLPEYFHSAGWGYNSFPEQDLLRKISAPSGAIQLAESKFLFKWNDCPDHHQFCDSGMIVDLKSSEKGNYSLDVLAIGLALSQSSKWISPTWTQAWISPFLEVTCGQKKQRFEIASSVGYNRKYIGVDKYFQFPMVNNSFLLPHRRHFEFECSTKVSEIAAGYKSSLIEREYDSVEIPGHEETIKF